MIKARKLNLAVLLALGVAPLGAQAGGNLDTFKFTNEATDDYGFFGIVAETTKIFWDERCASVSYTLNTVEPNALLSAPNIDIDTVRVELQESMDQWNAIPTSFIEMNITEVRPTGNPVRGFDFINELTFSTAPTFGALASSPSTSLQQDAVFAVGDDIDGDGDSDVYDPDAEGINVCTDIDGDGDIEFPAGFYAAGTILDNDVQFGARVTWATSPGFGAADIQAVAVHEFGHSHGLSHSLINRISDTDGTGSTMFPFIDTGDPLSEIGSRSLHDDDIAWSSFSYPEGGDGPLSSLQPGDVAFNDAYSVLTGEVVTGDEPIVGGNVYAVNKATGAIPVGTFNGKSTFVFIPFFNGFFFRADPDDVVVDGDYELPLPRGEYEIYLQSPDVGGATGSNINLNGVNSSRFGLIGYDEEGISPGNQEGTFEVRPGAEQTRVVRPGKTPKQANFVTNESIQLESFGTPDFFGTSAVFGQSDVIYATRFPNEELLIALEAGASVTTAVFQLNVVDASQLAEVERVSLALGSVSEDGTLALIDLDKPLREQTDFIAQDGDLNPVYFNGGNGLGRSLRNTLRKNPDLDVFVVVEMPNDFTPGVTGLPPLLPLDVTGPFGNSFLSLNGSPFNSINANWVIQLNLTP
jgi:hypothetical protein